ncbi:Glycosyltransferase, catalytic subunit of cellulose synthase and poly-beta-1,6-N-acetylglucosamine synthase [Peptoclostridium litorale DSM 5388]|uniref:Succinoglycan biosynthesis protein ExoA n=1 Tax=Peptoclostridium litorale DSM 5388 TaxID=1121324 RepID=A0A069REM1_PEPLI|nr:glycosyltransferase family 2 protein [Peptoclostridium litorale]KDR94620.1 succinoglycan biosynthesis protein ExoA [Peptoclostridium litorale DSM 5388]SIO30718.1 Glycosyltransferase, catalytic subunit of cellulose synthase and poly-beta-1,6-N-acetylglucosamine synthase [Peptoclostridium litorale DSM 5388]
MEDKLLVDIMIPVLNEERHIEACISSLQCQTYGRENFNIMIVDGGSSDETVSVVKELSRKYQNIKLLQHDKKYAPISLNMAINESRAKYIVRADAHTNYAYDYVEKCVEHLEMTGADNVGGPMVPVGKSFFQKVVAASYYSIFALGGGKFHDPEYEGYVDTVYLGAFRRESLVAAGMYDEGMLKDEDEELNFRIIKNGGSVFLTPKIRSYYYPRESLTGLFRQYFDYGYWKVRLIRKHKRPPRITHLVPFGFVFFLGTGPALWGVSEYLKHFYIFTLLAYLSLDAVFSISNRQSDGMLQKLALMLVHLVLHVSYGLGFARGIVDFWVLSR